MKMQLISNAGPHTFNVINPLKEHYEDYQKLYDWKMQPRQPSKIEIQSYGNSWPTFGTNNANTYLKPCRKSKLAINKLVGHGGPSLQIALEKAWALGRSRPGPTAKHLSAI